MVKTNTVCLLKKMKTYYHGKTFNKNMAISVEYNLRVLRGLFDFIITPKGKRYNNTKQVGDTKELILNASIEDHLMIN